MIDSTDVVHVWQRAGNSTPVDRLSLYAQALTADCPIGAYRTLNDAQEDKAILALFCVDRPRATIASLHQVPPLALSGYHQLLHDLAREGLGPEAPQLRSQHGPVRSQGCTHPDGPPPIAGAGATSGRQPESLG